uniref:CSON014048 protein n=1 Tax=Culicoides sonorensis TaxID=179676 RepID=A0A336KUB8_CULSO
MPLITMRQTSVLMNKRVLLGWQSRKARLPQNEKKVPFEMMLPLELRDRVSGKGGRTSEVGCVQEMTILFACLKTNEFNEGACAKEISNFNNCYKMHLDKEFQNKQERQKGGVSIGKELHSRELNVYLKKFPVQKGSL